MQKNKHLMDKERIKYVNTVQEKLSQTHNFCHVITKFMIWKICSCIFRCAAFLFNAVRFSIKLMLIQQKPMLKCETNPPKYMNFITFICTIQRISKYCRYQP